MSLTQCCVCLCSFLCVCACQGVIGAHPVLTDTQPTARQPKYPQLNARERELIKSYIDEKLKWGGSTVSLADVFTELKRAQQPAAQWPAHILRARMEECGVSWARAIVRARVNKQSPEWGCKRFDYALAFARALELERKGTHVLVYTDQSYVHTDHSRTHTYYNTDSAQGRQVNKGSKGELFILCHAMTKDGLLATRVMPPELKRSEWAAHACDQTLPYAVPQDEKKQRARKKKGKGGEDVKAESMSVTNAELFYCSKTPPAADYHNHFDADTMQSWVELHLFPSFQALYPGKSMILVLDNAAYHRARTDQWISVSGATKSALSAKLREWKVDTITVTRDGVKTRFRSSQYEVNAPAGPSRPELQAVARQYLKAHPELNLTRLQSYFASKVWFVCAYVLFWCLLLSHVCGVCVCSRWQWLAECSTSYCTQYHMRVRHNRSKSCGAWSKTASLERTCVHGPANS